MLLVADAQKSEIKTRDDKSDEECRVCGGDGFIRKPEFDACPECRWKAEFQWVLKENIE